MVPEARALIGKLRRQVTRCIDADASTGTPTHLEAPLSVYIDELGHGSLDARFRYGRQGRSKKNDIRHPTACDKCVEDSGHGLVQ